MGENQKTRKASIGNLVRLDLEIGEEISRYGERKQVKAVPVGRPVCIRHDLSEVPEEEVLGIARDLGANAYIIGQVRCDRESSNFTPIQYYRIIK